MPWLKPQPKRPSLRQSPEQMRKVMEQITLEMGGIVHKKNVPLA